MLPEDIDDLFRDGLQGHASPPGDDLWARLQAQPAAAKPADAPVPQASRLDELFRRGLGTHRTPPRRELWERLEDEHLRPRKRRAAAWWPMALAAAVALLLVAGGAGLWLGFPSGHAPAGTVAVQQPASGQTTTAGTTAQMPAPGTTMDAVASADPNSGLDTSASVAVQTPAANPGAQAAQPLEKVLGEEIEKSAPRRATRLERIASTASKARMSAQPQLPRHPRGATRPLDVAAENAPLVAQTAAPAASRPARVPATDEPQRTVAATTSPASTAGPAPETVPARLTPANGPATASTVITVEVRTGTPPRLAQPAVATAAAEAPRRGLGGRLLQQAGHLVRGERVSLAEAAGLPENVTLNATIAGRRVSKSIQL